MFIIPRPPKRPILSYSDTFNGTLTQITEYLVAIEHWTEELFDIIKEGES